MLIKEVMTRDVEVLSMETTIVEAAKKMAELDVGAVPVCEGDHVLGMVTDRDIVVKWIAQGKSLDDQVRKIMSPSVIFCFEDQDVSEAAHIMEQKQIRRLPVLDHDKKLVGILALGDLATELNQNMSGNVLKHVSSPSIQ